MFDDSIYYVSVAHRPDNHTLCLVYGMDVATFVKEYRSRNNRLPAILSAIPIDLDEFEELQELIGTEFTYMGDGEISE